MICLSCLVSGSGGNASFFLTSASSVDPIFPALPRYDCGGRENSKSPRLNFRVGNFEISEQSSILPELRACVIIWTVSLGGVISDVPESMMALQEGSQPTFM